MPRSTGARGCRTVRAAIAKSGLVPPRIAARRSPARVRRSSRWTPQAVPRGTRICLVGFRVVDEAWFFEAPPDNSRFLAPPLTTPPPRYLLGRISLRPRLTGKYVTFAVIRSGGGRLRWKPPASAPSSCGMVAAGRDREPLLSREGVQATGLASGTLAVTGGMDRLMGAGGREHHDRRITEMTGGALAVIATLHLRTDPFTACRASTHGQPDLCALMAWNPTAGHGAQVVPRRVLRGRGGGCRARQAGIRTTT